MKNPGCSNCDNNSELGFAYIDHQSGLLCITFEEKILPKGVKVLRPSICKTCGTTEWKTIDNK